MAFAENILAILEAKLNEQLNAEGQELLRLYKLTLISKVEFESLHKPVNTVSE